MSQAADDGHCSLPEDALVAEGVKIIGVPERKVAAQVPDLAAEEFAVRDKVPDGDDVKEAVYLPPFVDWDRAFTWQKARTGADLAAEQADAVRLALTRNVALLTDGLGCGKCFTVRFVVELARTNR